MGYTKVEDDEESELELNCTLEKFGVCANKH